MREVLDEIGEALGGVRHALRQSRTRRSGKFVVLIPETRKECSEFLWDEVGLRPDPSTTLAGKKFGIVQLVIVERMGQRHHDGGPADDAKLGDGGCAGSANDELRIGKAL